jgi:hypothetical protein
MRDEKNQPQTLDKMLIEMVKEMAEYSFTLGDWGEQVSVMIYIKDNGYDAESFSVKLPKIIRRKFDSKFIYQSEYDDKTNSYIIVFNSHLRKLNIEKLRDIIINIETRAINIYHIVVNSRLDSSTNYRGISMSFKRYTSKYDKIIKEIEESRIIGYPITDNHEFYEFMDQHYDKIIKEIKKSKNFDQPTSDESISIYLPAFRIETFKGKKKDINYDKPDLPEPKYYRFNFTVMSYQNFSPNFF